MTDTPKVDAYLEKPKVELRDGRYFYTEKFNGFVSADFARQLERDLATLKAQLTNEEQMRERAVEGEIIYRRRATDAESANDALKAENAALLDAKPDVAGLVKRANELAGLKYQSHTIHVPAVLSGLADALLSLAAQLAVVTRTVGELNITRSKLEQQLAKKEAENEAKSALLQEWLDTEMDYQDEEFEAWVESFTNRARAAIAREKGEA